MRITDTITRAKRTIISRCVLWFGLLAAATLWAEEPRRPIVNSIGMKLMPIPAGKFTMGSPQTEPGRQEREAAHKVRLTRDFYVGAWEVTQAEYFAVMKKHPSEFGRHVREASKSEAARYDQHPVESIAWSDAVLFCERLSLLEAEQKSKRKYRLPTEAEWEYACRAGGQTIWSFGEDKQKLSEHAWSFARNSAVTTQPVAKKLPNAWGLHDMHGNVWEWCADWYAEDFGDESGDPTGPTSGEFRVIRGGGFRSVPAHTRSATRFHDPPEVADDDTGLRVVMELD